MKKDEILNVFKELSRSQGFYCRILEYALENEGFLDMLEKRNFKDKLDLILYLES